MYEVLPRSGELEEADLPCDLRQRTRDFALLVAEVCDTLPNSRLAKVFADQAIRSGSSVGAHYREGHRARSTAEFISKLEVAIQELDETTYWFELISAAKLSTDGRVATVLKEADELTRILVSSVRTAKRRPKK